MISNMLYVKYAVFLGCFSTVGTLIGLNVIQHIVRMLKKASIIIFLLCGILLVSAVITVYEDTRHI